MSNKVFGSPSNTYSVFSPNAYFSYGMPLLDQGLVLLSANNGVGLVTRGLVWQAYDIWGPDGNEVLTTSWSADASASVTTAWTADPSSSITTSWSADSSSSVTTSWVADSSSSVTTTWNADNEFNDLPQH